MPTHSPDRTDPALDASTSNPEGQEHDPSVSGAPGRDPRDASNPSTGRPGKHRAIDASPAYRTYMGAGILFALSGFALAVGPRVSSQVAETLKPLGNPGAYAGALIAAGVVLLGFGILQRMFSDIRSTVDRVGSETQRIKNFANLTEKANASRGTVISKVNQLDNFLKEQHECSRGFLKEGLEKAEKAAAQRDDLIDRGLRAIEERLGGELERRQEALSAGLEGISDTVRKAARDATADLEDLTGRLNMQLERQAASMAEKFAGLEARLDRQDHEHSAGIEQLHDQLGERLDVSWNQRCASLEASFADLAEKANASNGSVTSKVNQLDAFLKEERESTRASLEAGFAKVDETSLQTGERIDHSLRAVEERTAADLELLSGHLDRQIESQAQSLAERFAGLEARLDRLDHERSSDLEQLGDRLGERLDASWNQRCTSLEESFTGLAEQAHASSGSVTSKVNQLDAFVREERENTRALLEMCFAKADEVSLQTGERIDHSLRAVEERTASGLEQLSTINEQVEGQALSLAERFAHLEARLDRLDQEHSSGLGQLGDRLGRELADRAEALQESLEATAELTGRKTAELATGLDRLDRIEELVLEQLCDFESLLRQATLAPVGTASEPQENLVQDGSPIEQELDMHTDALAGELMAMDESHGEAPGNLEEPYAEGAPIEEQEAEPESTHSTDESPGEENEVRFCPEPKAPFTLRKSKGPVPFGHNVDWNWSGLEDDTDRGGDLSNGRTLSW